MADVFDIIGIGLGPSHLALAVALNEGGGQALSAPRMRFFERKARFSWHPEMVIPGATVQVSFLKDLVTLRNPCSQFSFLNFLKDQGRLEYFVNAKEWYPSRVEFYRYLEWVAGLFSEDISYGCNATSIAVTTVAGERVFAVTIADGQTGETRRAYSKNVSLACGGTPYIPECAAPHSRHPAVCHTSVFLSRIKPFHEEPSKPYSFTVVGRGQSAAEIVTFLLQSFSNCSVTVVTQGYSFMGVDDNPFTNEIFFNDGVDLFYSASPSARAVLHDEFERTNYSVADNDLLRHLYQICYADRVLGRERLKIRNLSSLVDLTVEGERSVCHIHPAGSVLLDSVEADLTVLATGYRRGEASALLANIDSFISKTDDGSCSVDRHCRVKMKGADDLQLFLHGESESQHGISNTLLSVLPFRSGEIAELVRGKISSSETGAYDAAA